MKISECNTDKRLWYSISLLLYVPSLFFIRLSLNERETSPAGWFWEFLGHIFDKRACLPGICSEASALLFWALIFSLPALFLGWLLKSVIVTIKQIISATGYEPEMGAPYFTRLGLMLLAFALLVTGLSWLFLNQHSPMPCVTKPFWNYADFPAQALFLKVFDYHRSESEFFLLVFLQWLLVGAAIGAYVVVSRKTDKSEPNHSARVFAL
jgi:hypothetical protein